MKLKKVFCLFLSVMMIITAFSAVAVSANAENGMPDAAFTGGQPPEKPDGEMPGEPPEGMGGPGGGMGTPPDGAPGGGMGTPLTAAWAVPEECREAARAAATSTIPAPWRSPLPTPRRA